MSQPLCTSAGCSNIQIKDVHLWRWSVSSTLRWITQSMSISHSFSSRQPCCSEYPCTNRRSDATSQPQWKVNKIDHCQTKKSYCAGLYVGSVLRSSVKTVFKRHCTIVIAHGWYRCLFNCRFLLWWYVHLRLSLTLKPERSWNATYCKTQPTAKHNLRNDNFQVYKAATA